jgi:hypothetical protein
MTNRQPLRTREQTLLNLYSGCQLSMDVFEFYRKWDVTQRQIATICGCSIATVERWFGSQRQTPELIYSRRLAEMDLIWELWEQIPGQIREQLCPRENSR